MNSSNSHKFYQKMATEINPQMKDLTIALMNAKPDDPLQFMIDYLENERKGIKNKVPPTNVVRKDSVPIINIRPVSLPINTQPPSPAPIMPELVFENESVQMEEPKEKSKSPPKRQIKKIESQKTDIQDLTEIDKQIEQRRARIVNQGKRGGFSSSAYGPSNPIENYKVIKIMKGNEQKVNSKENGCQTGQPHFLLRVARPGDKRCDC